jgi:hypothetical protein
MDQLFRVGTRIGGFCGGAFGRDDYEDKICVMATRRYAVFEYVTGSFKGSATVLNRREGLTEEDVRKWQDDADENRD